MPRTGKKLYVLSPSMSSTVTVGGMEITSNTDSSDQMIAALTPDKEESAQPRVLVDKGEPVEQDDKSDEAKAAAVLGKKGGEATAAKKAEEAKEAEKAKAKKGDPRHDPTARVTEATREAKEAREELARERAEREKLATELARERAAKAQPAETPKPKAAPAGDDPEPQEGDFDTYAEYVRATARHSARAENLEIQKRNAVQSQAQTRQQNINGAFGQFFGRLDKALEADPAFADRTHAFVKALIPSPAVPRNQVTGFHAAADEIVTSEHAAALVDHFVEHPDAFQRIATLQDRRSIAREMAKIEAKLETASDAATAGASVDAGWKPASNPVRPVSGAPHAASPDIYGDIDFDTFASRRRAKG